jgi:hypothetical protein
MIFLMFKPPICPFNLQIVNNFFSTMFHTVHMIFFKEKHYKSYKLLILAFYHLTTRTIQPEASRYTD